MPPRKPTAFNWRDYIQLHDSLGKDKAAVERTLDSIAATGEDGQNLIKTAHSTLTERTLEARNRMYAASKQASQALGIPHHDSGTIDSKKIEIRGDAKAQSEALGIQNRGSHVHGFLPGLINLDMEQASKLTVTTPNGPARLSLTGIVVHELFHVADVHLRLDVKTSPEKKKELIDNMVPSTTLSFEEKKSVLQAFYAKLNQEIDTQLKLNPAKNSAAVAIAMEAAHKKLAADETATIADIAKRAGVPAKNLHLPFLKNSEAIGQQLEAGLARAEEHATRYTDVFMAKHFAGEPWRDVYKNGKLAANAGEIILRKPHCGTIEAGVYSPESITLESLGTLQQPPISAKPSPSCSKGQTPQKPNRPARLN